MIIKRGSVNGNEKTDTRIELKKTGIDVRDWPFPSTRETVK